jgi:penicillin-binding protein 1A
MASAYATLASDGEHHEPYFIDGIEDKDGNVLYKNPHKVDRAVSVQNARTVTSVLQQVVQFGTGTAAAVPGWGVAGKTGSTDDNADGWFVGVTSKLSTAVWMGSPAGRVPMYNVGIFPKVFGGTYPAMVYADFMKKALQGQTPVQLAPPDKVPNQRAPKFLELKDELNAPVIDQVRGNPGRTQPVNPGDGTDNTPTPTVPNRPQGVVVDPPVVTIPVITVPVITPDITTPRTVVAPPPAFDATTPTTRRNRGIDGT